METIINISGMVYFDESNILHPQDGDAKSRQPKYMQSGRKASNRATASMSHGTGCIFSLDHGLCPTAKAANGMSHIMFMVHVKGLSNKKAIKTAYQYKNSCSGEN